jgi:signal transduction histidine kinase/CheY-like chemotaxis protein/HPt (histidine-containing phosphotransfer) domain-containing protein
MPLKITKTDLSRSIVALLVVTYSVMSVLLFFVLSNIHLTESSLIETELAQKDISRVMTGLDNARGKLVAHHNEWGVWDESYQFIKGKNPGFKTDYLDRIDGLTTITHYLFLNLKGKVVTGGARDYEKEKIYPLESETLSALLAIAESFNADPLPEGEIGSGIVTLNGVPHLYAVGPVLTSSGEEGSGGTLIFTLEITAETMAEIAKQTGLPISYVVKNDPDFKQKIQTFYSSDNRTENKTIITGNDGTIRALSLVEDYRKRPAMLIETYAPEQIFTRSKSTLKVVLMCIAIFAIITVLMTALIIRKYLLGPLKKITGELSCLAQLRDPSFRLSSQKGREFGIVVSGVNQALASINEMQEELKNARAAAEAANQAKSLFIARVSHELRTPINGITGINQLVLKREKSPAVRELIKMADNSAWSLLSVINEILDFSKIESGNLTVEKIHFDIRKVAREAMQLVSGRLEGKEKLELVIGIDPNVPPDLMGDPTKLKQIFVNLLGNAIKFTQEGHVTLSIYCHQFEIPATVLKITVSDTGIGIPKDKLETIFEPFKQVDETMTRRYQGTGLGLTIVKQFTEALGGSVRVDSTPNKGTSFTIMMPVGVIGSGSYSLQDPGDDWPHIILVDGSSVATESLKHHLGRFGVPLTLINSAFDDQIDTLDSVVREGNLLVVTETALNRSRVFNAVVEMAAARQGCIIAMLKPSNLDLREKLHGLGIDFILPTPVLADDLILAYQGKLPIAAQSWDDNGDAGLRIGRKLKILVADDAPTNRLILEEMLTEAGHEVVCVNDGCALVDRITPMLTNRPGCVRFDIVLTDIQMPIMDGFAAVRSIRNMERDLGGKQHTKIIAVTAHALTHEREQMFAAGMDGVVTKPLRAAMIATEFERLLPKDVTNNGAKGTPTIIVETDIELSRIVREIWERIPVEESTNKKSPRVQPEALLDITDLFERSERSIKRTKAILKAFQGSFKEPLAHLAKAKISKNVVHLKEAAHTLKGLLLDIGAKAPAGMAAEVENFCKQNQFDDAARLVGSLTHQILLLARVIERLCETLEFREDPTKAGTAKFE